MKCHQCNGEKWVETQSPNNHWICILCGSRTDFGRHIMIKTNFGYEFKEDPTWKKRIRRLKKMTEEEQTQEEENEETASEETED